MRFLDPPPRDPVSDIENTGKKIFDAIGCVACHNDTFTTPNKKEIPEVLRKVTFYPFSDFLLHDMGSLGDGIVQDEAGPSGMRTQPLWGLRFETTLLHDGRVSSIMKAIQVHDGQAKDARNSFNDLSPLDQANLLAFLRSL